jgi:hypothetical protein
MGSPVVRMAFHLGPTIGVDLQNHDARLTWPTHNGAGSATMTLPSGLQWTAHGAEVGPMFGWYSERFGVKEPTTTLAVKAQLGCRVRTQPDDPVEVPHIMRALDPEVFDAVFAAVEPLLPKPVAIHPLGCHRPQASDRTCFRALLIRLVTGCSWVDAEQLVGRAVSDTTLRARRDE